MRGLAMLGLLAFTGCAHVPAAWSSLPGTELPTGTLDRCETRDNTGRCAQWRVGSGRCINPRGLDAEPPIMNCAEIRAAGLTPYRPAVHPGG